MTRRRQSGWLRLPVLVAAGLGAAGVLFAGVRQGAALLARPSFCSSCHVMGPQYVSHRRSAHGRASCVDCHAGQGCGACHTPDGCDEAMARRTVNAPGASGAGLHAVHAPDRRGSPGVACTTCHQGVMHSRMDGFTRLSPRASCGSCHGQTTLAAQAGQGPPVLQYREEQ